MIFITFYKIITVFIYVFVAPYAVCKIFRGSTLWKDRLGVRSLSEKKDIWIHAASAGEVKVVNIFVEYLLKQNPNLKIHLSVITKTGYDLAVDIFDNKISLSFFPLDVTFIVNRVINRLNPSVVVIAETEIWFNFLNSLSRRKIPVVLINGRMTERAHSRYGFIKGGMKRTLSRYSKLFVKSEGDARRYRSFGLKDDLIQVVGDMKFDAPLAVRSEGRIMEIRSRLGFGKEDFVLTAGSTRPGEEMLFMELYKKLKDKYPTLKIIIVPRHLERCEEIKQKLTEYQIEFAVYGSKERVNFVLVDKFGILNDLYMASNLAFVGGTFAEIGGHNILEPVWSRTPVVYGPSLSNVAESAEYIEKNNFGCKLNSKEELFSVVESVYLGNRKFEIKKGTVNENSPTAISGEWILSLLKRC